ncbi:RNA polymerase sigma-70 factor [Prolixibacteraceae bacterium JC049]|nr:RNA polymerase sigma-70 factor [Prolixibacteraceae bacterium JC049]
MENQTYILQQLRNNSKAAFRAIYDEYYEMLLYVSNQYLDNKEDAKETVQEAFVTLWEHRESIKETANIRNFLFTIAKNNCLNQLKHKEVVLRSKESLLWMEMHYQYEALNRLGFSDLEFQELQDKIAEAIDNLPGQCGVVFKMSRIEQLKNKEIAEKLNISEKTIEAHITKALRLLRKDLGEYISAIAIISNIFS